MNIDGKALAQELRDTLAVEVKQLQDERGITPGLTVVLVGEDPASQVYVRNKARQTQEIGMISNKIDLPADTLQQALLDQLHTLNNDPTVHGILVQLPLPSHIDEALVIADHRTGKRCRRLPPNELGWPVQRRSPMPWHPARRRGALCWPKKHLGDNLSGKHAVVIGRSNIVGKPVALLLLQESCTVTIAHSRTQDLPALCAQADILVAAVGRPRDGQSRMDQTRRHRHRRRHQPYSHRRWQGSTGRRCRLRRGAASSRRDHTRTRRRWPNDHRLPVEKHAGGRAPLWIADTSSAWSARA